MSQKTNRGQWGSRFGFIMAAAGSAVGLGNIWRFPYLAGENGGSAFVLIYLFFVIVMGISLMTTEFALGRRAGVSAVGSFKNLDRRWTFVGVIGVLTAFIIMGFYPVVGGWSLAYMFKSITGLMSTPDTAAFFGNFVSSSMEPLLWMLIYMILNIFIVVRGVSGGIEAASKVLMPVLIVLLIFVAVYGMTLDGSFAGVEFLIKPDFSAVTWDSVLSALGQAFFSMSLGMGAMLTYGSYLKKDQSLPGNAGLVSGLDTFVALLAGFAIFPALFAFGVEPTSGAGLVFMVVPQVFSNISGIGAILSFFFFSALTVAALTSSVSLLEVVTSYLIDEHGINRKKATLAVAVAMTILSTLASLSQGVLSDVSILGASFFDAFDIVTDKIFLAVGGVLIAIFAGWVVKKEDLISEVTNEGTKPFALVNVWYAIVKYAIPLVVGVVAVMGIINIQQRALMIAGLAIIAILAVFSKKL